MEYATRGKPNDRVTSRKRTEVVDRLCETFRQHRWNILRDSNALRSGDLISGFMKRIGLADHVIVGLALDPEETRALERHLPRAPTATSKKAWASWP